VVAWGSSFGGGHALHLAAEDHKLAAVIAQVGPTAQDPVHDDGAEETK
jgi:hypothetical protein